MSTVPEIERLEALLAEREPKLQALMPDPELIDRLLREQAALAAFAELEAQLTRPLAGIVVGVKDIFHVKGFSTSGGSRLPPAELAGAEGPAVVALKRAGALILGKTVSTEFAYFAPGPTTNPAHPEHTPGGSSSGSAAAVAAGYCPLALGTQTIGSIIRPAAYCGVVGFKPSYERISREGVIPLAPSVDHVGFFTPDVAFAARAAAVLCADWRPARPDRRPRLAIPEGPYLEAAWPEGLAHFRAAGGRLSRAGYEIVSVPAFADFAEIHERHRRLVAAEAAAVHAPWFDRYRPLYHDKTAELIERGRKVSAAELDRDRAGREALRSELTSLMEAHGIDLWLSPPAQGAAPRGLASTGDPVMNLPWSHAGMPALGLPAGTSEGGLPMGLQVTARFGADEALLAWGVELEEALAP